MSSGPIRLSRRGLMFVLSSPSGAGKSTLARLLLSEEPDLILSISVTTRQRRASEVDGQHYHFIDEPTFLRMREHGELLESAQVHGNYYGTPRAPVEKALGQGKDVLFDIDWQGTEQLAQNAEHASDLVRVFVLPPNFRELKARLERRAEDSSDTIRRRLSNARLEIGKWSQYDYVIVNEDLGESYPMARAILRAERVRRARVVGLGGFVEGLLQQADEAVSMMEAEAGQTPAPVVVPPPEEPVPEEPPTPEEQVPEEPRAPDDEPDVNGAAEQAVIAAVAQESATPSDTEPPAEDAEAFEDTPEAAEADEAAAEAGDGDAESETEADWAEPDEPDAGGDEAEAAESEPGPESGSEPDEDPDKT